MKTEEFASWARGSGEPLRVDHVVITTPNGDEEGYGSLRVSGSKFLLRVTLTVSTELPLVSGNITLDQFWKIRGRIEDKLPFATAGTPSNRMSHRGAFTVEQVEFNIQSISLATNEQRSQDTLTREFLRRSELTNKVERWVAFAAFDEHKVLRPTIATETSVTNAFLGKSGGSKLDTFSTKNGDFEFALIKCGEGAELWLRTKEGVAMESDAFCAALESLKNAIAFVHGRHAWPQHQYIRHGLVLESEDVYTKRKTSFTLCRILSERVCAQGGDYEQAIIKAWNFFQQGGQMADLVLRTLYLVRSASMDSTPLDVGTLSLCAVFEGLMMALHKELALPNDTKEEKEFMAAKAELLQFSEKKMSDEAPGFARILGLVRSAKPFRPQDAFSSIWRHFSLPEKEMLDALKAWKDERNALAHGKKPEDGAFERMDHHSRIAGAVNIVIAKLIGYSGKVIFSALESRDIQI